MRILKSGTGNTLQEPIIGRCLTVRVGVDSGPDGPEPPLLVYPDERTSSDRPGWSCRCQSTICAAPQGEVRPVGRFVRRHYNRCAGERLGSTWDSAIWHTSVASFWSICRLIRPPHLSRVNCVTLTARRHFRSSPLADILGVIRHVSKVPTADIQEGYNVGLEALKPYLLLLKKYRPASFKRSNSFSHALSSPAERSPRPRTNFSMIVDSPLL